MDFVEKNCQGLERPKMGGCYQLYGHEISARKRLLAGLESSRKWLNSREYRSRKYVTDVAPDEAIDAIDRLMRFLSMPRDLPPSPFPRTSSLAVGDPRRFTADFRRAKGVGLRKLLLTPNAIQAAELAAGRIRKTKPDQ